MNIKPICTIFLVVALLLSPTFAAADPDVAARDMDDFMSEDFKNFTDGTVEIAGKAFRLAVPTELFERMPPDKAVEQMKAMTIAVNEFLKSDAVKEQAGKLTELSATLVAGVGKGSSALISMPPAFVDIIDDKFGTNFKEEYWGGNSQKAY